MKKISILLVLTMMLICIAGCAAKTPSKEQMLEDVLSVAEDEYDYAELRNIKIEKIVFADEEDGKYIAELELSCDFCYDNSDKWESKKGIANVEYKRYGTDGWELIRVGIDF